MSKAKMLAGLACLMLVGAVTAGCSGGYNRYDGDLGYEEPGYEQYEEELNAPVYEEPSQSQIDEWASEADTRAQEALGLDRWACTYEPTMNDDWHDDVLCRKGYELDRPYLREWDGFVEEWELMESAGEYESQLNSGG